MNHVFEHLADPGATLNLLRTYLAPGGRLYIEVPNARSLRASHGRAVSFAPISQSTSGIARIPIHLMYYSVWTLGRLLEQPWLDG